MKKVVKKIYESGKPVKVITKEIDEEKEKPSSKPDKPKDK